MIFAIDQVRQYLQSYADSVDDDPLAEVKADPAALFRANGMEPDPAQIELLNCKDKDSMVLWPRQFAGKSTTVATIALHFAMTSLGHEGKGACVLVFSSAQRESIELLRKVRRLHRSLLHQHLTGEQSLRVKSVAEETVRWGRLFSGMEAYPIALPPELDTARDSQLMMELENGSRIISLPARSMSVVGYSADLLIFDEAKIIPDDIYNSVRQMQALTKGRMLALSTPLGQRGWFWEAWKKCEQAKLEGKPEPYRRFFRTCWDCPRLDREFVDKERQIIGDYWFRQEYECQFLDPVGAVFRGEDIERALRSDEKPYEVPW